MSHQPQMCRAHSHQAAVLFLDYSTPRGRWHVSIFQPSDLDVLDGPPPPEPPQPKNPSVFPAVIVDSDRTSRGLTLEMGGGLKLRDYFAAQVTAGLASQAGIRATTPEQFAGTAYQLADALLAHTRQPAGEGGRHAAS